MDTSNFVLGKDVAVDLDTDDCVLWPFRVMKNGYGVKSDRSLPQRVVPAHRWVYMKVVGPIPEGAHLDHRCKRRDCVNPRHLEPVTVAENNRRSPKYSVNKLTVCPSGHDLTTPDALVEISAGVSKRKRRCRICRNAEAARWRQANPDVVRGYQRALRERVRSSEAAALNPNGMPGGAPEHSP